MQLVFSDAHYWENFLPLTFTRPVAEMRCGILTFSERWKKLLNTDEISYITEDSLDQREKKACSSRLIVFLRIEFWSR